MPLINLKCKCHICQVSEYTLSAVDVVGLTPSEVLTLIQPHLAKVGWAVMKHNKNEIGRYISCPTCIEKTAMTLPAFELACHCPKCGQADMSATWRSGLEPLVIVQKEHLERECGRCHFKMAQLVLNG